MGQSRYRIVRRLAAGGMAEVFCARAVGAEGFEKDVCLKRVLPHFARDAEFVEMFKNEARLAAKLQHANIVQIFDFGEEGGTYFLAMEYVDGRDLRGWLEVARGAGEKLPLGLAAFVVHEAARGLAYAHQRREGAQPLGIVHRDVSPHNVLVSRSGDVKVADFGIAKVASRAAATRSGVLKGKVAYMSPEQARGAKIDARTDVFALGIVLWELCAGRRLFQGETETETLGRVLNAEIEPLATVRTGVPEGLSRIAERALERDVERRYASMDEMARELKRFLFSLPPEDATADGLAAWLAKIEPPQGAEGTSHTRLHSDPGTEPTSSVPHEMIEADARSPTRALDEAPTREGARSAARPETYASVDTVASAATSITRSSVRGRSRRRSIGAVVAGLSTVVLLGGAFAVWRHFDAVSDGPQPRGRQSASAAPRTTVAMSPPITVSPPPARGIAEPARATQPPISPSAAQAAENGKRDITPNSDEDDELETSASKAKKRKASKPADSEDLKTLLAKQVPKRVAFGAPRIPPPPTPPKERTAPPRPAGAAAPGYIVVTAIPWAEVFIDGKPIGEMPRTGVPAKPGLHKVRLRNKDRGYDRTFDLQVVSGERARLVKEVGE